MSRLLIGILAASAAFFVPAANAQPVCGERGEVLAALEQHYRETPVLVALSARGVIIEIAASADGTWTLIASDARGRSCVIDAGEGFRVLPPSAKGSF